MTKAILVSATGGPDVLEWADHPVGEPGPGEIKVRTAAAGLNFIDVYYRSGLYAAPTNPFVPGAEGAGTVIAVGDGVSDLAVGDRVAYVVGLGSYAEERLLPAERAAVSARWPAAGRNRSARASSARWAQKKRPNSPAPTAMTR